jgi:hypothetical protein
MSANDSPRGRPPSKVHMPPNGERIVARVVAHDGDALALSFAEMEAIIGEPLPLPWRTNAGRWNDDGNGRSIVRLLRASGWRARLD